MADSKKPVEAASAAPGEKRAASRPAPAPLRKASEATDGYVHKLLGDRNTADMNGDADGAARVTAELAELGYE